MDDDDKYYSIIRVYNIDKGCVDFELKIKGKVVKLFIADELSSQKYLTATVTAAKDKDD
jgi:hypothetical protein